MNDDEIALLTGLTSGQVLTNVKEAAVAASKTGKQILVDKDKYPDLYDWAVNR